MQDAALTSGRPQPSSHYGYVADHEPLDCRQCITRHAEHYKFPELPPRYYEAWSLFMRIQDQQRVGMEAIGLDYNGLPGIFDLEGIVDPVDRRRLFGELMVLNHALQAYHGEQREDRKREADRKAAADRMRGGRR